MRRFIVAMLVVFMTAGFVLAKEYMVVKKSGNYTVHMQIDKNPPVSGHNNMKMSIHDDKGAAVVDAAVIVDYGMAAMPGMPPMAYKAKTELKGTEYTAVLNFSMSGPWYVNIKITRGGKTQTVKFNVDVG